MKKHIFELALAIGLVVSCTVGALALQTRDDISEKLIRLHVIANSDSAEDQNIKLKVRDEILKHVAEMTSGCTSINDVREIISSNLNNLKNIADNVLLQNGFKYKSAVELSYEFFPTKTYDTFALPTGEYEALRIKLGKSNGQNWWCVLFPPVCVSAAEAKTELKNAGLSDDEIKFVMSDDVQYRFKFKLVEIIEGITEKFL